MPFNVRAQRQTTRSILIKWETDQGNHECAVTYRLGVLGTFAEEAITKMTTEDWIAAVVAAWDVTDADGNQLPPSKEGFDRASAQGDPIPPWFLQLVTDAIYNDARPPTLTSRDSADTF